MASFLVFFEVSGRTVEVVSPKSSYSSAEASYFDCVLQSWIATATRDEIQSQK